MYMKFIYKVFVEETGKWESLSDPIFKSNAFPKTIVDVQCIYSMSILGAYFLISFILNIKTNKINIYMK